MAWQPAQPARLRGLSRLRRPPEDTLGLFQGREHISGAIKPPWHSPLALSLSRTQAGTLALALSWHEAELGVKRGLPPAAAQPTCRELQGQQVSHKSQRPWQNAPRGMVGPRGSAVSPTLLSLGLPIQHTTPRSSPKLNDGQSRSPGTRGFGTRHRAVLPAKRSCRGLWKRPHL